MFQTTRRCKRRPSGCLRAKRFKRCWMRPWRCKWGDESGCRMRRSIRQVSKQLVPVPIFLRRRKTKDSLWKTVVYQRFPKLSLVSDVCTHFILAVRIGNGPRPDIDEFRGLIDHAPRRVRLHRILADAGYDSEPNHQFARDKLRLRTIIPAKHGRPTDKPASGRYRRLMQLRFDADTYRQRSQVETVMSMIKRRQGNFVRGKTEPSRDKELHLMVLPHNVMILWWA